MGSHLHHSAATKSVSRAEILFHEATARSSQDRDQFLAEACASDSDLRAEVNELLQAHEEAGGFLGIDSPRPAFAKSEFGHLHPEQAGEFIGVYKLLEQIGQG